MELEIKELLAKIKSKTMELIINQDMENLELDEYSDYDQEETVILNSFAA